MDRKPGRPKGGCLTSEQKQESIKLAKLKQKQWRSNHPKILTDLEKFISQAKKIKVNC